MTIPVPYIIPRESYNIHTPYIMHKWHASFLSHGELITHSSTYQSQDAFLLLAGTYATQHAQQEEENTGCQHNGGWDESVEWLGQMLVIGILRKHPATNEE